MLCEASAASQPETTVYETARTDVSVRSDSALSHPNPAVTEMR
jgi:hypothetical protein